MANWDNRRRREPHDQHDSDSSRPQRDRHFLRRELHADRHYPRDQNVDQIGDYVARRLIPELQRGSERPVQLVMNFGTLHVQDDLRADRHGNAVVYNAPGCTMILGRGYGSRYYDRYDPAPGLDLALAPAAGPYRGGGPLRLCARCGIRRGLGVGGYCRECELDTVRRVGARDYLRFNDRTSFGYVTPRRTPPASLL